MTVIKTGKPVKKVFVREDGEGWDIGFQPIEDSFEDIGFNEEQFQKVLDDRIVAVRAEWEKEVEAREAEAYEKGRVQGEDAARADLTEEIDKLNMLVRGITEGFDRLSAEAQEACVDIAIEINRRFVHTIAENSSDLIKETIKAAVKLATEKEKVVIRVNPEDLDEVRKHQDDIIFIGDGISRLEIRPDKLVDRGGCIVETEAGNIDARVDTRLSEIEKSLKDSLFGEEQEQADEIDEEIKNEDEEIKNEEDEQ